MEELWLWSGFGGLCVIGTIFAIYATKQNRLEEQTWEEMKQRINFNADTEFTCNAPQYWIGINNESEEIKIVQFNKQKNEDLLKFSNIISVELTEDGQTIYSKSTIRTIGGTVIGGALAGGAGAIVGGLSGSSTKHKKVYSMNVKLLLRDYKKTSLIIEFYDYVYDGQNPYPIAHKKALEFIDKIKVIIDKIDRKSIQTSSNNTQSISISKEIEQLYQLKVKGIISEEDFQGLKKRYLSNQL